MKQSKLLSVVGPTFLGNVADALVCPYIVLTPAIVLILAGIVKFEPDDTVPLIFLQYVGCGTVPLIFLILFGCFYV